MRQQAETAESAMNLLRRLLEASWTPELARAKPVVFDFVMEKWSLTPGSANGLIRKGAIKDAAVTLTSRPAALLRLLTEPGFKPAPFEICTAGDVDALNPIIDALKAKQSALTVRINNRGARS